MSHYLKLFNIIDLNVDAVIATGSLRRRAQWLSRFPTHSIVDLRGNVNSRLQKLTDSYLVSNDKIVKAIGKPFPISAEEGFKKTFQSFHNQ